LLGAIVIVTLAFSLFACGSDSGKSSGTSSGTSGSKSLSGTYTVKGTNPDGSSYRGTVTITGQGPAYSVAWKIAGDSFTGEGTLSGTTFNVRWHHADGTNGTVAYTLKDNGQLTGPWSVDGNSGEGQETLTPND
jgi:hypothetical protein